MIFKLLLFAHPMNKNKKIATIFSKQLYIYLLFANVFLSLNLLTVFAIEYSRVVIRAIVRL